MSAGKKFNPEICWTKDADTGVKVGRVTGWRGNHNHLYFTNNSFFDNNTKFVIVGDRDNVTNFFSVDTKTFEITQLTDLEPLTYGDDLVGLEAIVDPVRNFCYFFKGKDLYRLNLMNYELISIYHLPDGFEHHVVSCAYDAEYVYTSIYEDLSDRFVIDIQHGYIGFDEICAAHPLSQIIQIRYDGSESKVIHEEKCWIAHVNVSQKYPTHLTFCHEGHWQNVDHRIWGMDVETGKVWKIHEIGPGETVGHEYWYQDGYHIGYHGTKADGTRVMGKTTFDNSMNLETLFPYNTGHIYSRDEKMIVGDGSAEGKYVRVWKWNGEVYEPGRALCQHFSSFKEQNSHPHPAISPDGKWCIFTSDRTGYNQVYMAQIPEDLNELPLLSSLSQY